METKFVILLTRRTPTLRGSKTELTRKRRRKLVAIRHVSTAAEKEKGFPPVGTLFFPLHHYGKPTYQANERPSLPGVPHTRGQQQWRLLSGPDPPASCIDAKSCFVSYYTGAPRVLAHPEEYLVS